MAAGGGGIQAQSAGGLLDIIEQERKTNRPFVKAFGQFAATCCEAINPNLSDKAVEEMLIQHVLTERIFRKVFDNPYFLDHNLIARDIKQVILALTSRHFSPQDFLKQLNRFYVSIESTAGMIDGFAQKQAFLNTVYEKFFQGYAVKVADTHGIVYTPQPIVRFMVNSVEEILKTEFGRSLSDKDVHILDPFVGTGNFLIHVMRSIKKTALRHKYEHELHCNEVMLMPYYVASMNLEHEYYELTGEYRPFEGMCFVDTFELAEERQLPLFIPENSARVERQKKARIFVIIGNPPYNVGQVNENDNNKNRKYTTMDKCVVETYAKASAATNKNALSDVYVKAFKWASERIQKTGEGIVAFVTNNSFLDGYAFDGMRKHLAQDFDAVYVLDLGGNVRQNPKLSGTTHNVFGIQVGVSIALLVKKQVTQTGMSVSPRIFYARLDEFWRKEQKYNWLDEKAQYAHIEWREITPDKNHLWLTEGMSADFETFMPMGTKKAKASNAVDVEALFKTYSRGAETSRDAWTYNFDSCILEKNVIRFIETYNHEVYRWHSRTDKKARLDDFVLNDDENIKWSSRLKESLLRGQKAEFSTEKICHSLYRPFCCKQLFFDNILTHRQGQFPHIFPTPETEHENSVMCVPSSGSKHVAFFMTHFIPDLNFFAGSTPIQCFPFYTYDKDGSNRTENITDWALAQFRARYDLTPGHQMTGLKAEGRSSALQQSSSGLQPASTISPGIDRCPAFDAQGITKWDIFYYVYAVLHHPRYREKYAANLKRELPRIPFAPDFRVFAEAGKTLAELHVNYEQQPEYPLEMIENPDKSLDWRVEKMKLIKPSPPAHPPEGEGRKCTYQIIYNAFLTLGNIPPAAFDYRLGNRSALDWIIDQHRVKTDKRSGITNDPNRADDPDYIVRLIKQVVTVSVETVKIVNGLPKLEEKTS